MRVVRLLLLCLLIYVLSVIFLFPVAPVAERVKPQIPQVALEGITGKLYNGNIASVRYLDDLLPIEFSNVGWKLAPGTLLKGGAGANIRFEGYGGGGDGQVLRHWNGDLAVQDFKLSVQAKELEVLLPVPLAAFNGTLSADIPEIVLKNQLLHRMQGSLVWQNAVLERPVPTALGTINLEIQPDGEGKHIATLDGRGGDVDISGTVNISLNGDFSADVSLKPTSQASPQVINGLRQMARPDASGTFRLQRTGNVNRLL